MAEKQKLGRAITKTIFQTTCQRNFPVLHAGSDLGKDNIIFFEGSISTANGTERSHL